MDWLYVYIKNGETALMAASRDGRVEVVKVLLSAGADKDKPDILVSILFILFVTKWNKSPWFQSSDISSIVYWYTLVH